MRRRRLLRLATRLFFRSIRSEPSIFSYSMQNLDFSPRLRGRRAEAAPEAGGPGAGSWSRWKTATVVTVIIAGAAFVGGLSLGLRLGRYGQEEDRIVRNAARSAGGAPSTSARTPAPESLPGASGNPRGAAPPTAGLAHGRASGEVRDSLANRSRADSGTGAAQEAGRYVILLGSYSPEGAERLLGRLKRIPRLRRAGYHNCRAMTEAGSKEGVFQLTHPHNRALRRVYVGCHRDLREANAVLSVLRQEGLLDSTNAQLIDIE